jgi:SnoaL-like domain
MFSRNAHLMVAFGVGFLWLATTHAQQPAASGKILSAQDRAEIELLLARYTRALSACAAKEYAELFTPDGMFISDDFRSPKHRELYGKTPSSWDATRWWSWWRPKSSACIPDGTAARARTAGSNANRPPVSANIEATADGAKGTVPLAGGGRYEDVYVKTSDGWRFKSRSVFMPPVKDAPRAQPAAGR